MGEVLDFCDRSDPHIVYLDVRESKFDTEVNKVGYRIPVEVTAGELERILEIQNRKDELYTTKVKLNSDEAVKLEREFCHALYAQLEILFKHYDRTVTVDFLVDHVTKEQAVEIIEVFSTSQLKKKQQKLKAQKKPQTN